MIRSLCLDACELCCIGMFVLMIALVAKACGA